MLDELSWHPDSGPPPTPHTQIYITIMFHSLSHSPILCSSFGKTLQITEADLAAQLRASKLYTYIYIYITL